jgi:hypothetical protein
LFSLITIQWADIMRKVDLHELNGPVALPLQVVWIVISIVTLVLGLTQGTLYVLYIQNITNNIGVISSEILVPITCVVIVSVILSMFVLMVFSTLLVIRYTGSNDPKQYFKVKYTRNVMILGVVSLPMLIVLILYCFCLLWNDVFSLVGRFLILLALVVFSALVSLTLSCMLIDLEKLKIGYGFNYVFPQESKIEET